MKVEWNDFKNYIEIDVPEEFSFKQCMVYLNRSNIECLHKIKGDEFYKLLKFEGVYVLINISMEMNKLRVTFMNEAPEECVSARVAKYGWNMLI